MRGKRAVISVDLGVAVVHPEVAALVTAAAESLIADAGLARVDVAVSFPPALFEWAMSNLVTLAADLGDKYPACEPDLTPEIMLGLNIASHHYDLAMAATAERFRVGAHEVMANLLDEVDFIFCSTNPDVAFGAEGPMPTKVGDVDLMEKFGDIMRVGANQGNLTFPANFAGNPAVSDPGGHGRRPARGDAGHRPAPPGGAPARPGAHRRARAAVAPGGPRSTPLMVRPDETVRCVPSAFSCRRPIVTRVDGPMMNGSGRRRRRTRRRAGPRPGTRRA